MRETKIAQRWFFVTTWRRINFQQMHSRAETFIQLNGLFFRRLFFVSVYVICIHSVRICMSAPKLSPFKTRWNMLYHSVSLMLGRWHIICLPLWSVLYSCHLPSMRVEINSGIPKLICIGLSLHKIYVFLDVLNF